MTQHPFISRFSPGRTDPDVLEAILVQRHDLLERAVARLRESALTPNKHHLLFVGPRGCGKTHLLALIFHRLQRDSDLADRLRVAWLCEDETSTSLLDLLVRIYRALAERYEQEFPRDRLDRLFGTDPAEALAELRTTLIQQIGERTVLVMIENLDQVFRELALADQRAWRALLQDHPRFATVATAQRLFDGVAERDQPFFGFFDTIGLKPLTVEEAAELLQRIAHLQRDADLEQFLTTTRGRARIRAIHHLSGGNHRLYVVLSDFISGESLDDLVRLFEELVDEQLTAYYQERLRWLSAQQRKIVEFLCRCRTPVPVKQIAGQLFATHSTITSQLKELRALGYVIDSPHGREVLYELAEPLMRLTVQVKTTDRQPLGLLVDFLRVWYDRDDLAARLSRTATDSDSHEYLEAALTAERSGAPSLRLELLRHGLGDLDLSSCNESQIENLRDVAEETNDARDWYRLASACFQQGDFDQAVDACDRVIDLPGAPTEWVAGALVIHGMTHEQAGRTWEAIDHFTRAIELPDAPPEVVASALGNRGKLHELAGRMVEAMEDLTRAIDLPGAHSAVVAGALFLRGVVHGLAGRTEDEIADYTRAIELPGVSPQFAAMALFFRGIRHGEAGRTENAIADFTRAIELPDAPPKQVAWALYHRGLSHRKEGRTDEAIADFTRVIELPHAPAETVVDASLRVAAMLDAGRWSEEMRQIDEKRPATLAGAQAGVVASAVVRAVFREAMSPEFWRARAANAVGLFARGGALARLGDALVRHLVDLAESPLGEEGREQWFEGWSDAARDHAEMQLPLRLLQTGIEYLKARNEKALLRLPIEERALLRQVFDLPPDSRGPR